MCYAVGYFPFPPLWTRLKNAVGPEYVLLITGGSITRANSGNGALLTRESEEGKNEDDTMQ